MQITYTVKRGKNLGVVLTPHRYEDGMYLAHKTNSRNDPEGRRVSTQAELIELIAKGYHVRMSNTGAGHAPSTGQKQSWAHAAPKRINDLGEFPSQFGAPKKRSYAPKLRAEASIHL